MKSAIGHLKSEIAGSRNASASLSPNDRCPMTDARFQDFQPDSQSNLD
ncbi:MAG: hypothetical protein HC814_04460 [Rhodobacteraceae bacterium]|nr:hypothetical protein [Paracoccaceae bacterium]